MYFKSIFEVATTVTVSFFPSIFVTDYVFNISREEELRRSDEDIPLMPQALRQLDTRARAVFALKGIRCLLLLVE